MSKRKSWLENHDYDLRDCEAGINIINGRAFLNIKTPDGKMMTFTSDGYVGKLEVEESQRAIQDNKD